MRVFTKCSTDAGPARLSRQINLRVECYANPNRQIFPPDSVSKLSQQLKIINRSQTQGLAPLREIGGGHRRNIAAEMITRIGRNRNRNAQTGLLGKTLELV